MVKKGHSRRDFLKIVGATTGIAAAGCSPELPEKLIPYVIQPDEVIPGIPAYYSGSCSECSAGCGITVKTREGRAIKVEGNAEHPINKGALCGLGQSSLQTLYDPDRVRQPLKRDVSGAFQPITWEAAIEEIATAIKAASKKKTVVVSKPVSGSSKAILDLYKKSVAGFDYIPFEVLNDDNTQLAAEKSFGKGYRAAFDFSRADVVVAVGADFLDTWGSTIENSYGWSRRRSPDFGQELSTVYHIEPRFSVTAANADKWIKNAPGTEPQILLALLKLVVDHGGVRGLRGSEESAIRKLVAGQDVDALLQKTSVERKSLVEVAKRLVLAKNSLIVADGAAVSATGISAAAIANLINVALGNIGKTVLLSNDEAGAFTASYAAVSALVEELTSKKVGVVFFNQVNPAFSLPVKLGFERACTHADLVVALATNLDETARVAQIVLPASTNFEAWDDAEPRAGVFNLNQPAMQPLYETQSLGDTLVSLAGKLAVDVGEVRSFYDFIKAQWLSRLGSFGFESKWVAAVERGGEWKDTNRVALNPMLAASAFDVKVEPKKTESLTLVAYPTGLLGDGSGGNRAWLQEIPDAITTAVWGSWVELHPDTAAKHGIENKQVVRVEAEQASIEAPVYITKRIHPDVVAVPMGRGHTSLGRFADGVGVNPMSLLPAAAVDQTMQFTQSNVRISRSYAKEDLIVSQIEDKQGNRGILRAVTATKLAKKLKEAHHHGHDDHHAHRHHDPLALGPQPEAPQMYKQMEHVQYRWGMSIDLNSCTGCNACIVACYAENNIAIVGRDLCREGRELAWIRMDRYFDDEDTDQPNNGFMPMLCQHCNNAPCEPVCPVYATYHNEEGLNLMAYNRCVGTRYCSNNCSYKVRRFNWFTYQWPEPLNWQLNPDVTVREVGIMEKCNFCVQRIKAATNRAKDLGRPVPDGEIKTACEQTCATGAIRFGNLNDKNSLVSKAKESPRTYKALDGHLNTQPALSYLAKIKQESI